MCEALDAEWAPETAIRWRKELANAWDLVEFQTPPGRGNNDEYWLVVEAVTSEAVSRTKMPPMPGKQGIFAILAAFPGPEAR